MLKFIIMILPALFILKTNLYADDIKNFPPFKFESSSEKILNSISPKIKVLRSNDEISIEKAFGPKFIIKIFNSTNLIFFKNKLYSITYFKEFSNNNSVINNIKILEKNIFDSGIADRKEEIYCNESAEAYQYYSNKQKNLRIAIFAYHKGDKLNNIFLKFENINLSEEKACFTLNELYKDAPKIMGLNFGMDKNKVKQLFSSKGITLIKERVNTLTYSKDLVNFPNVDHVVLYFYYDILISQRIYFDSSSSIFDDYIKNIFDIKKQLTMRYGDKFDLITEIETNLPKDYKDLNFYDLKRGAKHLIFYWDSMEYGTDDIYIVSAPYGRLLKIWEINLFLGGDGNKVIFYLEYVLSDYQKKFQDRINRNLSDNL